MKDAEVYYYKPKNCKAIVIVKTQDYCSFYRCTFLYNSDLKYNCYFKDLFNVYNTNSSQDVKKITYGYFENELDENNRDIIKEVGAITTKSDIKKIFSILLSNDLRYKNHSHMLEGKYITIRIHLKNGLIIGEDNYLKYYPNSNEGYVSFKGVLNNEQNNEFKEQFVIDK